MRVMIYVRKDIGATPHLAADIDPSMFGFQEVLQEVVAKATFHDWHEVTMRFFYPEKTSPETLAEYKGHGIPADAAQDMTPAPAAGETTEAK